MGNDFGTMIKRLLFLFTIVQTFMFSFCFFLIQYSCPFFLHKSIYASYNDDKVIFRLFYFCILSEFNNSCFRTFFFSQLYVSLLSFLLVVSLLSFQSSLFSCMANNVCFSSNTGFDIFTMLHSRFLFV